MTFKVQLTTGTQAKSQPSVPDLIYIMGQIVKELPESYMQVGRGRGHSGSITFGALNSYGSDADDMKVEAVGTTSE